MKVKLRNKEVEVQVVYDTNKAGRYNVMRNMMNMTGRIAREDCYNPRLQGNTDPLYVYRKGYRTWLLSEAALTAEEQEKALEEYGQRPRHLDALLESDEEKYEAQLHEAEGEEEEV
jgi:hypothetical protein